MSRPRYLADEDLYFPIVQAMRRLEPTIEFQIVADLALLGAPDARVLEAASERGLIVVSHDVTTMSAAARARVNAGLRMPGLFLGPQSRRGARTISEDLLLIWLLSEAEEWKSKITFLPL
jgi:hypothetical protein